MGRLIVADAITENEELAKKIRLFDFEPYIKTADLIEFIDNLPTANVDKDVRAEAYNKGLEDIWKLLDKTESMSDDEYYDCFGESVYDGITKLTPQEALAKLEAYEKEQAEIKVGDVVKCEILRNEAVVTRLDTRNDGYITVIFEDGSGGVVRKDEYKKTGKHIDIQSLLEQIKE